MAYISKEETAAIRKELKAAFPDFKFSVRIQTLSAVNVTIKKSPVDFSNYLGDRSSANVSEYHHKNMTDEQIDIFRKIFNIIKTAPAKVSGSEWYDNSDAMTDYIDTAYYYYLSVQA